MTDKAQAETIETAIQGLKTSQEKLGCICMTSSHFEPKILLLLQDCARKNPISLDNIDQRIFENPQLI